jgi:hypothetical protein
MLYSTKSKIVMRKAPTSLERSDINHAVSAEITQCDDGRIGVRYLYRDGTSEVKPVGASDWAVIRKLMGAGKLFYCSEEAREGMAEIFTRGLDR